MHERTSVSLETALAGDVSADDAIARILGAPLPARIDGASPLSQPMVLHVAAVSPTGGARRVLRIVEQTPRSAIDNLLLHATRAWADIVLTSGKILRDEPDLCFDLGGPSPAAADTLRASRSKRTSAPLRIGVLSSGSGLHAGMEVWKGPGQFILLTDGEGAHRSAQWAARAGVEVAVLDPVGPRTAVQWATAQAGVARSGPRVSVEFGASSSVHLYGDPKTATPSLVDLLILSEYLGVVPGSVLGARFLPGVDLERRYAGGVVARSGDWRFGRWTRRDPTSRT